MKNIFLDTNILLGFVFFTDPWHKYSTEFF